jgi:hypothetical protein
MQSVLSGAFMDGFEDYASDGFPFRENLRAVKAAALLGGYRLSDKSGIYRAKGGAGKFEKISPEAWKQSIGKANRAAKALGASKAYFALIPDKSHYQDKWLPGFDLDQAQALLSSSLEIEEINISNALSQLSFYKTDLHWDQSRIEGVAKALGEKMGFGWDGGALGEPEKLGEFLGVYAGQLALPLASDEMSVFRRGALENARAYYFRPETLSWEEGDIYDPGQLGGIDPYNVFLGGPQPLVRLENENIEGTRELVLVRDSFGSSLAPLLAPYYRRITLVDLRYVSMRALFDYIEVPEGSDALFLFSSQLLNSPTTLLAE